MAEVAFNPFDPEFRKNPHPFYDKLRELEPVHITPLGFVVLTRYDDVVNTLRNNDFSRDIELNAEPVGHRHAELVPGGRDGPINESTMRNYFQIRNTLRADLIR